MNKKFFFKRALIGLLTLLLVVPPVAFAQSSTTGTTYSQQELAQMLAPIALYPDSLLAQVLVAATYPDQIREARIWVEQHPDLKGDALNNALDQQNWDLSVKALVPFPKVLVMLDDKPDWTQRLGDAFLAQQADVMSSIQTLRARARAEGNLKDTGQEKVLVRGDSIEIQPVDPEVIYVPYYDPTVVYGPWLYPAYPPYAYFPYYPGADFIAFGVLGFAAGIAVGAAWNWGWGSWDWGRRDIDINVTRNININRNSIGTVRTARLSRAQGRQILAANRTTAGLRGANRLGAGAAGRVGSRAAIRQPTRTRPSTASIQNQLRRGSRVARNQAATRPGTSQLRRGTVAGNRAIPRRGATNLSRGSAVPRGRVGIARGGMPRGGAGISRGFAPRGGVGIARGGMPRGGAGISRGFAPRGGAGIARGGMPRGGAGISRGGGGFAARGGGCHGPRC